MVQKLDKKEQIKEIHKRNIIAIAEEHKKSCKIENCKVSLHLLMVFAIENGITFTEQENETFL